MVGRTTGWGERERERMIVIGEVKKRTVKQVVVCMEGVTLPAKSNLVYFTPRLSVVYETRCRFQGSAYPRIIRPLSSCFAFLP